MKNDETKKSISERIRDKLLLFIVAAGCFIILFLVGSLIFDYLLNRIEWTVSVSGDELRLEDTVEVLKNDGTYKKTIHCIRKQDCIWFIGDYRQYVYTIYGPGVEFHPVIKFHKIHPEVILNEKYYINFDIYRNGDQWDATVTRGNQTEYFEDIENNEIYMEFNDV